MHAFGCAKFAQPKFCLLITGLRHYAGKIAINRESEADCGFGLSAVFPRTSKNSNGGKQNVTDVYRKGI